MKKYSELFRQANVETLVPESVRSVICSIRLWLLGQGTSIDTIHKEGDFRRKLLGQPHEENYLGMLYKDFCQQIVFDDNEEITYKKSKLSLGDLTTEEAKDLASRKLTLEQLQKRRSG